MKKGKTSEGVAMTNEEVAKQKGRTGEEKRRERAKRGKERRRRGGGCMCFFVFLIFNFFFIFQ